LNRVTDLKVFPQPQLGVLKKNRTTEKAGKKKLTEKTEPRKKNPTNFRFGLGLGSNF